MLCALLYMQERKGENYWNIIGRCQKEGPLGVAHLATLLLDLATFQTPLVTFFFPKSA